jgi:uncharacterized repeat protein (TIGR03803 family)
MGSGGSGTLYTVSTNGSGFTNLHNFTSILGTGFRTNSDGAEPYGGLILSGNTLYGAACYGGGSGTGALFAINTNGTGFTNLYSFTATSGSYPGTNSDGAIPRAALILTGDTLYGTAYSGGRSNYGTVFKVNTNGMGFTTLHTFNLGKGGGNPYGELILSSNTLYGTTQYGGSAGYYGTVFALDTNGANFKVLHSFTATSGSQATNTDGANPYAGLILSGNTLFGTTSAGGQSGEGTIFKVNTDGTGFTALYSFTATTGTGSTNSDGANPHAGLILSGDTLYGVASRGGRSGLGAVFAVKADGTGFTNLYNFIGFADGAWPYSRLFLSGNTLFGTAASGGSLGNGTVFSLPLPPPQLTMLLSGTNVILTWSTNANGFTLQTTTNLVSPAGWTPFRPGPTVVNGQNTVTNPVSETQTFYRLIQ